MCITGSTDVRSITLHYVTDIIYSYALKYSLTIYNNHDIIQYMGKADHPLTGRPDMLRKGKWRDRMEEIESMLGHVICGARVGATGEPCLKQPLDSEHRCEKHNGHKKDNPHNSHNKLKYPPRIGYGMNLNTFIQCHRCKEQDCSERVDENDDDCPVEQEIFARTMELKDKYTIDGDYLQTGMLESVAFLLIHRFRAEKAIASEGMTLDEMVAIGEGGKLYTSKKPHPLLKHLMDINKQINTYSKSMEFSPAAIRGKDKDDDIEDAAGIVADILRQAHKNRAGQF